MAAIDVFAGWGQSNRRGRGTSGLSPDAGALAYQWTPSGGIEALSDPVGESPHDALTGSAAPAFARDVTAASGVAVCYIASAVGGSAILPASGGGSYWTGAADLLGDGVVDIQSAMTALSGAGWTPTFRGVLWHQGERDAQYYPTPASLEADYQAAFAALWGTADALLGYGHTWKFYVARVGTAGGYESESASVRSAQDAVCAESSDYVMTYTGCSDFSSLGYMQGDNLHYTQAGYNAMGAGEAVAIAADLGYTTPPPSPSGRSSALAHRLLRVVS